VSTVFGAHDDNGGVAASSEDAEGGFVGFTVGWVCGGGEDAGFVA